MVTDVALIAGNGSRPPETGQLLPAKFLYQSGWFKLAWRYAQTVLGLPDEQIYVLSVQQGLVNYLFPLIHTDRILTDQALG